MATVLVSPLIVGARLEHRYSSGEAAFSAAAEALSVVPGHLGGYCRWAYYRWTLAGCCRDVSFGFGTKVNHRGTRIDEGVIIGSHCNIGTAWIGHHSLVGSRVCIPSGKHQHVPRGPGENITDAPAVLETVHIGDNVWLGEGAIVMADVGSRCVVAAGSVVFRPVPEGTMAMGNPARVISAEFSRPNPAGRAPSGTDEPDA